MQVEAKKAFEEYEMYEEIRNGIKVRAKVSNVERERSKEIELIAVLVRYIQRFRRIFEGFGYWLPEETVKDGMENVRKFVKRIKELIK